MSGRTAIVTMIAATCLIALSASAPAATYLVRANGSGDYATIQDAIDAAVDTDIIELADGTFDDDGNRDIDYLGKAITIRSESGDPADVTIDCEGDEFDNHRAFWFHNDEGSSSILQNITIVHGYIVDGNGGGILCEGGAAPTIEGCVFGSNIVDGTDVSGAAVHMDSPDYFVMTGCRFIGNTAGEFTSGRGGAVSVVGADQGELVDCVFGGGNFAGAFGGGVYLDCPEVGGVLLRDCVVTDNGASAGAGVYSESGGVSLDGCAVYWNEATTAPGLGGGVYVGDSCNIVRSTFMGNFALSGGGIYFSDSGNGDVNLCIVAYSLMGGGIHVEAPTRASINCSDVYENTGGNYTGAISDQTGINDNISEEPQFCDAASGDLTLYNTSPCASEYSPCGSLIGANEVDCLSVTEPSSWGKIKSDYR